MSLSLPDANAGPFVSEGTIIEPSGVTTRSARPLDANPGGLPEVVIPNPEMQIDLTRVSGVNPPF
jgi:hypothetical protein